MRGFPPDYAELKPLLLDILLGATSELSEHALLRTLADKLPYFDITDLDPLGLFQRHFLLFHCLYRLQQDLRAHELGQLLISALTIRVEPYLSGQPEQLEPADPLRSYYLDLSHLEMTGAVEVDEMLANFWRRLARHDHRSEALAILGLSDPVANPEIKQRYRELVMTHHPDRGGDTARIQILNAAMAELFPKKSV